MSIASAGPPQALQQLPKNVPAQDATPLSEAVKKAWIEQCDRLQLSNKEKALFESFTRDGFENYPKKLEAACEKHTQKSSSFRILDRLQPIVEVVEMFSPAAAMALAPHPNPGSLVLGGVLAVMQTTRRLVQYQKRTIRMLAMMGSRASLLLSYEKDLYKDEQSVQNALVKVFGAVIAFCLKAVRFLTNENGELRARVKGLKLAVFRDFDAHFDEELNSFNVFMDEVEASALHCDKKRLQKALENSDAHRQDLGRAMTAVNEHFKRAKSREELLIELKTVKVNILKQSEQRKKLEERRSFLEWLSPLNFHQSYEKRRREHYEETGTWFLNSDNYKKWRSSKEPNLLWVRGKPGCGKSMLAAVTINDVKSDFEDEKAVAYAFCEREGASSLTPVALFGALAKQIISKDSKLLETLESEYFSDLRDEIPSMSTLQLIINKAMSSLREVYIIIDGLDQCYDIKQMIEELLDLFQSQSSCTIKMIVFSRPDHILMTVLGPYEQVRPDKGHNDDDLKAYIGSCFEGEVNHAIRQECIDRAQGMFLWVRLLAEHLQRQPLSRDERLEKVKEMLPSLSGIYDRTMDDIWKQDERRRSTAFLVLMWITHARRAINEMEMLEAVVDCSKANGLVDIEGSKLENPEGLVALTMNLVYIDENRDFRLIHESVRDYLGITSPDSKMPLLEYQERSRDSPRRLSKICLEYLLLKDFDCALASSAMDLTSMFQKAPFLRYAASFWGEHLPSPLSDDLQTLVLRFLCDSYQRRELAMQISLYKSSSPENLWKYPRSSTALHVLSIFGLKQVAELLPNAEGQPQQSDGPGPTSLNYSLIHDHHDMTAWLIEKSRTVSGLVIKDTDIAEGIYRASLHGWLDVLSTLLADDRLTAGGILNSDWPPPLTVACEAGQIEAAKLLIEHNADVDKPDSTGHSPLILATRGRHTDLVMLLLQNGANPNCCDQLGTTPLHHAASHEDTVILKALIAKQADPEAKVSDRGGATPFHFAAIANSISGIQALFEAYPNIDSKSNDGHTALHFAASNDAVDVTKLLLKLKIDKDAVNDIKMTALAVAACRGHHNVVKVLMDAGCDPNILDVDGDSAMHAAASSGKLKTVKCVLERQPEAKWQVTLNTPNLYGKTPLHIAANKENPQIVTLMLQAGADASLAATNGWSALHYAAATGNVQISHALLKKTVNVNPQNEIGDTPLHLATRNGWLNFIKRLFQDCSKFGIDVDTSIQNNWNDTALIVALENGYEDIAKLLMQHGFVSRPDKFGQYPIHFAAWRGYTSIVEQLIPHEGVASKADRDRTPLFYAACHGHLQAVTLLLEAARENLDVAEATGETPVFSALSNRHLDVTNFLLDKGADWKAIGANNKQTMLHMAAKIGNLAIVQRLLSLKCDTDAVDISGDTAFHLAVQEDHLDIVRAFIEHGIDESKVLGFWGGTCVMMAATRGNLEMLALLEAHGASYGAVNELGESAAHYAARNGHWDILGYLVTHGEDVGLEDIEGNTPLIRAASNRNPDTVKYLLKTHAHTVNNPSKLYRATALSEAAKVRSHKCIAVLLAAGADPHHRDAFGLSALEIAAMDEASRKEMLDAGYRFDTKDEVTQKKTLRATIRQCSQSLLEYAQDLSSLTFLDFNNRLDRLLVLASALRLAGDYEFASICQTELFRPSGDDKIVPADSCELCGTEDVTGELHLCKSCYDTKLLCNGCYVDYWRAGYGEPKAHEELIHLERQLQLIRMIMRKVKSVRVVYESMTRFEPGRLWLAKTIAAYEAWEQAYNSDGKYKSLDDLPGYQFINTMRQIMEVGVSIDKDSDVVKAYEQSMLKRQSEYEAVQRKHKADEEIPGFPCRGHEYFSVTPETRQELKTAGQYIDSNTERVTPFFLNEILKRHVENEYQPDSTFEEAKLPAELSEKGNNPEVSDLDNSNDVKMNGLPGPRRALTLQWPGRRGERRRDLETRIGFESNTGILPGTDIVFGPQIPPAPPSRASTLPVALSRSPAGPRLVSEQRDIAITRVLQAGPDPTTTDGSASIFSATQKAEAKMIATINIAFGTMERDGQDMEIPISIPGDQSALSEQMRRLSVIDEPETMNEPPQDVEEADTPYRTASNGNIERRDTAIDDRYALGEPIKRRLQIIYMTKYAGSGSAAGQNTLHGMDSDAESSWWLAIQVTEKMAPGFVVRFLEEHEDLQEDPDEESELDFDSGSESESD